ncbi:hypothetical protein NDU88_001870 [Pleurodeles waltl]|uniref:Uncharacterized protein n=1 Tax=Pleurodeles waltl TaxID=8319 RepID=A0AAV7SDY0_PLEWA|nr:hypothetical protein NDU88_001870 [Pleurodeles waltl]
MGSHQECREQQRPLGPEHDAWPQRSREGRSGEKHREPGKAQVRGGGERKRKKVEHRLSSFGRFGQVLTELP